MEDVTDARFPKKIADEVGGVDWDDRLALQQKWTLQEKGWTVQVEWKHSAYGVGAFALQKILAKSLMRVGVVGRNLLRFHTGKDLDQFHQKDAKRLRYLQDYFYGHTDRWDYEDLNLRGEPNPKFMGVWLPGHSINHSATKSNMTFLTHHSDNGQETVHMIATKDIHVGEELLYDYRLFGQAPEYVLEFAKNHGLTLSFPGCNDYV